MSVGSNMYRTTKNIFTLSINATFTCHNNKIKIQLESNQNFKHFLHLTALKGVSNYNLQELRILYIQLLS